MCVLPNHEKTTNKNVQLFKASNEIESYIGWWPGLCAKC